MPHIRFVRTDPVDAVYINGTKVEEDTCIGAEEIFQILKDNLGIDAHFYDFTYGEYDDTFDSIDELPERLKDYDNIDSTLINKEDKI
jgi:aminopeptidase C